MSLRKNIAAVILIVVILVGIAYWDKYHFNRLPPSFESAIKLMPRISTEPEPSSPPEPDQSAPPPVQSSSSITITTQSSSNTTRSEAFLKVIVYTIAPLSNQSQPLTAIDWSADGPIMPGQTRNSSRVYFFNEGSAPITLYVSTSKWTFKDASGKSLDENYSRFFSLTWDYDNSTIAIGETRPVTFSLTVSARIIDVATFSFDIVVTLEQS